MGDILSRKEIDALLGTFNNNDFCESDETWQANFTKSKKEKDDESMKFKVKSWYGAEYEMTAQELDERIKKDSKSNYNWIACATELFRVCNEPDFPKEYAQNIKVSILNCFASIIRNDSSGIQKTTDKDAIISCYNSLNEMNNVVIDAKLNYLKAVIQNVTKYAFEFHIYKGSNYNNFCSGWETEKFNGISVQDTIDFDALTKIWKEEYCRKALEAGKRGEFADEESNMMKIIYSMMKE